MIKTMRLVLLLTILFIISFPGRNISSGAPDQAAKAIVKGREVPEFAIKLIGGAETLTKEKLLGKVYLLDFWWTRCKKCQDGMPFLHGVYEKYQYKDFMIISIAADSSIEDVETFRKDRWKMPWLHSLAVEGNNRQVTTVFEVNHLPKLVLVDRDGKIVCTNDDTDELGFEKILEEIFK